MVDQVSKDAYYFSHDCNARRDPKILEMRSVYGMEGFGWYWVLVEMLREQTDYKLKLSRCNGYAFEMQCTPDAAKKFIDDCINEFELFVTDGEYFWSESLLRRMKEREQKSEQAKAAAKARWEKKSKDKGEESASNADAMQTHSDRNAIKGKESKVNKSKEKEKHHDDNIAATVENEFGRPISPVEAEKLNSYLEDGMPEGLVCEAIRRARLQGKPIAYADGILKIWLNANIKTIEAVKLADLEHDQQKAGKQNPRGRPEPNKQRKSKFDVLYM